MMKYTGRALPLLVASNWDFPEIKMTAFLVERHLPFQAMDHLSDLVTDVFSDSDIAEKFQSKHTNQEPF